MSDTTERKLYLKLIWPPMIVASVIFYLSCLIAPSDVPEVELEFFIPVDKMVHFCMYFGLSWVAMCNYIYVSKGNINYIKLLIFCILLPVAYGGLIEILQDKYFDREGDWWDFLANLTGLLVAIPFAIWFKNLYYRKTI